MPHMVIFRDAEGKPGYHTAEGLDEAVRFELVEHSDFDAHHEPERSLQIARVTLRAGGRE